MAGARNQAKRPDKVGVELTRSQAATLLGCSDRQILRLHDDEGLPVVTKGRGRAGWKIDGAALIAWWVDRELRRLAPQRDLTLESERLRLTSEQADEKAIANAESRGELIRVDHVKEVIFEAMALLGSDLTGVGSRIANELAGTEDPAVCRSIILRENNRVRSQYADRLSKLAKSRIDH